MVIQIRECQDSTCLFRFPQRVASGLVEQCPLCGSDTTIAVEYETEVDSAPPLGNPTSTNHKQDAGDIAPAQTKTSQFNCEVLLDNLRSVFNVGAIFRSCDGAGVQGVHLAGTAPTPAHPRFAKTALGTERTIPWLYHKNGLIAAQALKASGRLIIGLESGEHSRPLYESMVSRDLQDILASSDGLLLIVGNEVGGIDPEILELCDMIVALPMTGMKSSLNVSVAFGIAIYHFRFGIGLWE